MDVQGVFIFLSLTAIIILYIKNIREIIISAKKSKLEIITVIISVIVIIGIIYLYGKHGFII